MIKLIIDTVNFDEVSQMGIVILKEEKGNKIIPIWVGLFEAQAIIFKMRNLYFPRPLTHDLLKNTLELFEAKVEYILISDIKENTYYAEIHIIKDDKKLVLDSRPSDAIALSVRVNAPIYVDEKVLDICGVDKEEFLKQQEELYYKQYLENLDEEDKGKLKH